ncbi:MAG: hypothetical protein ACLPKW_13680, partial [Acetobacteraceae bacterium]
PDLGAITFIVPAVLSSNADPQAALSSAVSVVSPSSTAAAARTSRRDRELRSPRLAGNGRDMAAIGFLCQ